jgi:hypothetical protein
MDTGARLHVFKFHFPHLLENSLENLLSIPASVYYKKIPYLSS